MLEIIPLFGRHSVGQSAIVSPADFRLHGRYIWYATAPSPGLRLQRAYRPIRLANGRRVRLDLAREILGLHRLDADRLVTFRSRNYLDCRRENIQVLFRERTPNLSRFEGVSYCRPIDLWRSEITLADGGYWFLGYSRTEQQAAAKYHLRLDRLLAQHPEYANRICVTSAGGRNR